MLIFLPESVLVIFSLFLLLPSIFVVYPPIKIVDIPLNKVMVELTPFSKLGSVSGASTFAPSTFELPLVNFIL